MKNSVSTQAHTTTVNDLKVECNQTHDNEPSGNLISTPPPPTPESIEPRAGFNLNVFASELNKVCPKPHYAIVVEHYAKNDSLWEKIYIGGLSPNKVGKFPLLYRNGGLGSPCDSVPEASFELSREDLGIAAYVVLNKSDSYINIESFNTSTKEVKGTFDITFVANGTSAESRKIYPDTVRFNGAKFTAIIN